MIGAGSYLRRLDASKKGSSLVRLTILLARCRVRW